MTYTLIEWVKENVEELFSNYSDEAEPTLESMDNLNIAEKVLQLQSLYYTCSLFHTPIAA